MRFNDINIDLIQLMKFYEEYFYNFTIFELNNNFEIILIISQLLLVISMTFCF